MLQVFIGPHLVISHNSDKFCEQGGAASALSQSGSSTVTFKKPYKNTNYSANISIKCVKSVYTGSISVDAIISDTNYSTTGFVIAGMGIGWFETTKIFWKASGYIA